ncbi:uncharacterized protein MONBRDRAFT_31253 [Monosiga brevicollis MX1]|uniref:Cupin-like domain-containing protein n=1 Tax=Monosiga brevicollis TaxID=81824 RepID=A9USN8_MONBE|nr:uncharacterized protein MONBRDRAFT_31253 [Monosiga brevicollis MX1]EDQ91813.1 predicted protein [Monosiga brevicollis MX1]|eukprot:XP_001743099.1 hypothetical protein [Monosiga brevicollis MX1]
MAFQRILLMAGLVAVVLVVMAFTSTNSTAEAEIKAETRAEAESGSNHRQRQAQSVSSSTKDSFVPDGFVPISIGASESAPLIFCQLDFDIHSKEPWTTPMFKDWVRTCKKRMTTTWSAVRAQFGNSKVVPTGFVFHQSRVGSTLVSNMLAADPANLVYAESAPPATIALHCDACTRARQIELLRLTVTAMGNSRRHSRLFFKFQSVQSTMMDLYREAFPDTPFIYVYRKPAEILASQFQLGSTSRAPCVRSFTHPTDEVLKMLSASDRKDRVAFCAAVLGSYGAHAVQAIRQAPGHLGVAINYEALPAIVPDKIMRDVFGVVTSKEVKERMLEFATHYSKVFNETPKPDAFETTFVRFRCSPTLTFRFGSQARSKSADFEPDTEKKEQFAAGEMEAKANKYMLDTYKELEANYVAFRQRQVTEVRKAAPLGVVNDKPNANPRLFDAGSDSKHSEKKIGSQPLGLIRDSLASGLSGLGFGHRDKTPSARYTAEEELKGNYLPYPPLQPLHKFLEEWNPDEPDIPDIPGIAEGTLERFDFSDPKQRARAETLRINEVPFMLYNVPEINDARDKWAKDEYLKQRFGKTPLRITTSTSNHFMYFNRNSAKRAKDYDRPTGEETLLFDQWLERAYKAENASKDEPHFYLQLNSVGPNAWIREDLPSFNPVANFFIADPTQNRGINCRFGARGIIAENHYDGGRNFVAMIRGAKRYIILPPEECPNLYLWPRNHPESRHSRADWSQPDFEQWPKMKNSQAAQVVVRAGEVLYIPRSVARQRLFVIPDYHAYYLYLSPSVSLRVAHANLIF